MVVQLYDFIFLKAQSQPRFFFAFFMGYVLAVF